MNIFKNQYMGKKVLVTGHTGFKGSWLSLWLHHLGANVIGLSASVPTNPSHFESAGLKDLIKDIRLDIRDSDALHSLICHERPDVIFHMAAQALVRPSYENPLETISTNALGTANLLNALRCHDGPVVAIMITSDKAYDNREWVWGYRETDRLGGKDPYSASKGMAELAIRSFVESYFSGLDSQVRVGITRAGNVIGGGDWAKDRIVPDCMKSWSLDREVEIRSPAATRPWQHVLEPLSGYLHLGATLLQSSRLNGQPYNFGPPANQNHTVAELIDEMAKHWTQVKWKDVSFGADHVHEAGLLKLNCDKALVDLDWAPVLNFAETVKMTVDWYRSFYESGMSGIRQCGESQIAEYVRLACERNVLWSKG